MVSTKMSITRAGFITYNIEIPLIHVYYHYCREAKLGVLQYLRMFVIALT